MNELAKDTLIYCLEDVIREAKDTVNLYVQNKLDDKNIITVKTGNAIFWVGACIYKFKEYKVKYEPEDYIIISAFRAAVNALKHNKEIVKLVNPAIISSPVSGACFSGSSSAISRFHSHIERCVIWDRMTLNAVNCEDDAKAFNEHLAMRDVLKSLDLIQNIIIKYLNKLN